MKAPSIEEKIGNSGDKIRSSGLVLPAGLIQKTFSGLEESEEFQVSRKYVSDGKVEVSFDQSQESHLNWRQHSKVCDIWF